MTTTAEKRRAAIGFCGDAMLPNPNSDIVAFDRHMLWAAYSLAGSSLSVTPTPVSATWTTGTITAIGTTNLNLYGVRFGDEKLIAGDKL